MAFRNGESSRAAVFPPATQLCPSHSQGLGWDRAFSKGSRVAARTYPQGTRWPGLPRCSCWGRTWSRTGSRWWSGSTSGGRGRRSEQGGPGCWPTSLQHHHPSRLPAHQVLWPVGKDRATKARKILPTPTGPSLPTVASDSCLRADCVPGLGTGDRGAMVSTGAG